MLRPPHSKAETLTKPNRLNRSNTSKVYSVALTPRRQQQEEPDDYVIATGETHSVKEFVDVAFNHAGIEIEWHGTGLKEKSIIRSSSSSFISTSTSSLALSIGEAIIEIDPRYFRPLEVEFLEGNASKAKRKLKWEPKVRFNELVKIMADSDIKDLEEMRRCQDVMRKLSSAKNQVEV